MSEYILKHNDAYTYDPIKNELVSIHHPCDVEMDRMRARILELELQVFDANAKALELVGIVIKLVGGDE